MSEVGGTGIPSETPKVGEGSHGGHDIMRVVSVSGKAGLVSQVHRIFGVSAGTQARQHN